MNIIEKIAGDQMNEIRRCKENSLKKIVNDLIGVELNDDTMQNLTHVKHEDDPGKESWYWKYGVCGEELFLVWYRLLEVDFSQVDFKKCQNFNKVTLQIYPSIRCKIPLEELIR